MSLRIVIPAFNEAENLPQVLTEFKSFAIMHGFKIIIVNDGSTDNTSQIIRKLTELDFIKIIEHRINKGYGNAIKSGICSADTDYVITVDADGQHCTEDILNLYYTITSTGADLVIGGRFNQKNASKIRGIGKSLIRYFVKLLIKVPVYDINSGMKIYRTELARKYVRLAPSGMAFSDVMTIIFVHFGDYVLEIPIKINKRLSGKSTINYKTGLSTIKEILFIATVFAPYRFFSLLSSIILLSALIWGLPFIFQGKGFTTATAIGIMVSILLWSLGIIAQLISGIRKDLILNSTQ
ncbi:MAG TPA: glycosyltransferase family 2 protein [Hanamia sp.]|nr:glycosyltransferase family 2 protein [Hanamia sp.]